MLKIGTAMKRPLLISPLILAVLISYLTFGRNRGHRWQRHYDAGQQALAECRYPEARTRLDAAVESGRAFGERDPRLAWSLMGLGHVCLAQAKDAESERHFRQALAILETLPDGEGRAMADCLTGLAIGAGHRARDAEAGDFLRRALAVQRKTLGPDDPDVARSLNDLAWVECNEGHYA